MAEATMTQTERPPVPALQAVPRPVDVSVVIVTWNSERWIERCLGSLAAACEGLSYEVVIFDNASVDATLRRLGAVEAKVLRAERNEGLARGTNLSARESRGRYLFLLNPDCELEPGALTKLCRFLDSNPNAAAAAPHLVDESGDSQRYFQLRRLPTLRGLAAEALLLNKLFPRNKATAHYRYTDLDLSAPQRVEQPAAAAMLIRHDVFDAIGGFDEQFSPAWFEDVDLCRRLHQARKELFVVPSAVARHFGGASLEHMTYGEFIDVMYRNMWRYARKWFSPGKAEGLRWAIIAGMLLRCAAALAGLKNGSPTRRAAIRAYATVMQKAVNRWGDTSPSSS
jgi:N-acetylglucosaminyl-diphospho-decaprenol L-rhamnosyltransferase